MSSYDTWLAARSGYLTASDVAPVMGLSPYKTRDGVMQEKLGALPLFDISRQPRVAAGRYLEAGVIAWALFDRGWEGHGNGHNLVVSPTLPYLAATPDAYIETPWGHELMECKNVAERSRMYWKADAKDTVVPSTILRAGTDSPGRGWAVPRHYWCQLMVQLHCTNKESGWIVACVGGVDRVDMRFLRDRAWEEKMLSAVQTFWAEKTALEVAFGDKTATPTNEGDETNG